MNWRTIRWVLLIILVILNITLFGYSELLRQRQYVVPEERIESIRERYQEAGYTLPEKIERRQYPKSQLILKQNDLEARAEQFFEGNYEQSYMPGSRVLYSCGTESLTLDRDHSMMIYANAAEDIEEASEEELARQARELAERMMQTKDLNLVRTATLENGTVQYTWCESYKGEYILSNRTVVTISGGKILRAAMTQYAVEGFAAEEIPVYPIDELLYSVLPQLAQTEGEELSLIFGYAYTATEDENVLCDPVVWVIRADGSGKQIDRFSVSLSDLT